MDVMMVKHGWAVTGGSWAQRADWMWPELSGDRKEGSQLWAQDSAELQFRGEEHSALSLLRDTWLLPTLSAASRSQFPVPCPINPAGGHHAPPRAAAVGSIDACLATSPSAL